MSILPRNSSQEQRRALRNQYPVKCTRCNEKDPTKFYYDPDGFRSSMCNRCKTDHNREREQAKARQSRVIDARIEQQQKELRTLEQTLRTKETEIRYLKACLAQEQRKLGSLVPQLNNPIIQASETIPEPFKTYKRGKHGFSDQMYETMVQAQNDRCKICGEILGARANRRQGKTDHCHRTGKIRGILCLRCNSGLGMFRDNPEWLRKAAEYIED